MEEFPPQGDSEMARYEPGDYRIEVPVSVAREGIEQSCPDLEIERIEPYGRGVGDAIFRVNDNLLFKFAKHEKASGTLEKENAMLPELKDQVSLPIPEIRYSGYYGGNRLRFIGYQEVKGEGLKSEDTVGEEGGAKEHLAKQLAEFTDEIQSYDVAEAKLHGVPEIDPRAQYENERSDAREQLYLFLEEQFPKEAPQLKEFIETSFEKYLSDEENFSFELKLIHGDLEGPAAIRYDKESDEISGIIDFGGLEVTDPDRELWRLYAHYGKEFMDTFLKFKPCPNPERLYQKLEFFWTAQEAHRIVRRLKVEGPASAARLVDRLRNRMGATRNA